jgi:hypothetical protein
MRRTPSAPGGAGCSEGRRFHGRSCQAIYALQILRAIRDQHPNVQVGTWVDPYTVAFEAGLGHPDGPSYGQAIEYLVKEDAIERAEETATTALGNPIYRIKRRGIEMMEEE